MYKTIRHGENSLQYTILPQNDDTRMDGKLTSTSNNCINNNKINNNCQRNKRSGGKNRSFYAYLGLLFVCTVIIGAILIPFLVSAECIPNPSDWFLKTKITFSGHNNKDNSNNKTNTILKNSSISTTSTTIDTITLNDNKDIIKTINIQYTDSTTNKAYPNENNIDLGLNDDNNPTTIISTNIVDKNDFKNYNNLIVNKKIFNKIHNNVYKIENDITAASDAIDNTNNNNDLVNDENNNSNNIDENIKDASISHEISTEQNDKNPIQKKLNKEHFIDEVKFDENVHFTNIPFENVVTTSELSLNDNSNGITTESTLINNNKKFQPLLPPIPITKKPIILPVLAKTNSVAKENGLIIQSEHKETKNWIKSHWPFIDPSTYFQWTGYKSEDSVLLPAILGITLIGIIIVLTLCLVARNKKTIVVSIRKRNRNDVDETGEDNATLLTTANLSDADDE